MTQLIFLFSPDQKCASEQHISHLEKAFEAMANRSVPFQKNIRVGSFEYPAISCKQVAQQNPASIPGYFWVRNSTNQSVFVYCIASTQCCNSHSEVGWMRVAYLDMTDPHQTCPQGFRQVNSPKRTCARRQRSAGCSSVTYNSHGINYTKICGRIISYQYGSPSGFYTPYYPGSSIDGPYLEGVSVTHGQSPRKHIWSFANALQEAYGYESNRHICPCRPNSTMQQYIPSFVGNDYFCDTGIRDNWSTGIFYSDDPLWDGQGCDLQPDCCKVHSPPWFCKKLSSSTNDGIEVRICADQEAYIDEDSPIELIELYIQ